MHIFHQGAPNLSDSIFWYMYLSSHRHIHVFSQDSYSPPSSELIYVPHHTLYPIQYVWSWLTPCTNQHLFLSTVIIDCNIRFPISLFWPQLPNPPHYTVLRWREIHFKNRRLTYLRENSKSASTKRETILERNATRMRTGNLYRETGSVYFYLININLPSHFSERNVELVKLHTGHIFIRYKMKIYSLLFLHSSG